MTVLRLPIQQDGPQFHFTTELDGNSYSFEFRWNRRDGSWFMTVGDGEGAPIVHGVKVVLGVPLLQIFSDSRLPTGQLIAEDTGGTDTEAGYADLGRRVVVLYIPAAEVLEG